MNFLSPTHVLPIRDKSYLLILATLYLVALSSTSSFSAETMTGTNHDTQEPLTTFKYIIEGRADPFVPFIAEKASTPQSQVDMNEIVDSGDRLTGMQLFEPGQLKLVALLERDSQGIAMVEDFTGKGYVLHEGTKIGRRGVVKDVASNSVVIEETAQTRAGKKIITEVVMVLKKEGEE